MNDNVDNDAVNDTAILENNVTKSIESMLEDKQLKYIADTPEFIEGLLVGLEIAGIYGDEIKNLYTNFLSRTESEQLQHNPEPPEVDIP